MEKNIGLHLIFALFLLSTLACSETVETAPKTATKKNTETQKSANPQTETSKSDLILFFGNSLTAAYGIDPEAGFVNLIQEKILATGKAQGRKIH